MWILKVESLVLKKKRECEREEGEGDTHEGLLIEGRHLCWHPISNVGRQCQWRPTIHRAIPRSTCLGKGASHAGAL
jgi:hypothetical protein